MRGLKRRVGSSDGYGNIIKPLNRTAVEPIFGQLFIGDTITVINKKGTRISTWRVI